MKDAVIKLLRVKTFIGPPCGEEIKATLTDSGEHNCRYSIKPDQRLLHITAVFAYSVGLIYCPVLREVIPFFASTISYTVGTCGGY